MTPSERVAEIRTSVIESVAGYRRDSATDHIGFVPGLISVKQSYAEYLADERILSIDGLLAKPLDSAKLSGAAGGLFVS